MRDSPEFAAKEEKRGRKRRFAFYWLRALFSIFSFGEEGRQAPFLILLVIGKEKEGGKIRERCYRRSATPLGNDRERKKRMR